MISVLFSWIIIFGITMICGYGVIQFGYRKSEKYFLSLDVILVAGILCVNVYAQFFSLIYKVGRMACFILFIIGTMLIFLYHILTKGKCWKNIKQITATSTLQKIMLIFIIISTLSWTVGYPQHYDTSLYHNQAIQWIEEYGVVLGLGNLHNRFAYNSSFMVLQALFSFKWLVGQSLHTVNGFICCLFLSYSVLSNNVVKRNKIETSDFLKLSTIIYVFYTRDVISSPSSDILAMLLILYIVTKWCEYLEKKVDDAMAYTFLAVLSVYAISVKLSVATCIILAIYPAVLLMQRKKWKEIVFNILFGVITIMPWILRNVAISGYLIYPYPQIDLFKVDWKMPVSVLTYDNMEIMVWGRKIKDVLGFEMPIYEWFPIWFKSQENFKILIIWSFVAAFIVFICRSMTIIREKRIDLGKDILAGYSMIALMTWIFSAPLMRYGMVYLLLPICLLGALIIEKHRTDKCDDKVKMAILCLIFPLISIYVAKIENIDRWIMQENYEWILTKENEIGEGIKVWTPVEGDQSSYDVFPCVPYEKMIERVEVRGESYGEGFRIKEECKDMNINAYGEEW